MFGWKYNERDTTDMIIEQFVTQTKQIDELSMLVEGLIVEVARLKDRIEKLELR